MTPLTDAAYARASARLSVPAINVRVAADIENPGSAYLPDGRLRILYERHVFHRLTGGRFSTSHPDLSAPTPFAVYGSLEKQWDRLTAAIQLDADAAFKSCSWGRFQLLGEHFAEAGFRSVTEMVNVFKQGGEAAHLDAFCDVIQHRGLADELAAGAGNAESWAPYARGYNGKGYWRTNYHGRCADLWRKLSKAPQPTLRMGDHGDAVLELQRRLNVVRAGGRLLPIKVDGDFGLATRDAVKGFQQGASLTPDAVVGPATWSALPAAG